MPANVGDYAPDFEAESTIGKIKLSDFKGKNVVLYFYPKSFTPGCTREIQRFVELYDEFKKLNTEIIGVSADSISTQKRFAEKYGAKFPVVDDKQKKIIKTYGVLNLIRTSAQRITFIIDSNGKVVEIVKSIRPEEHANKSLEIIKKLLTNSNQ